MDNGSLVENATKLPITDVVIKWQKNEYPKNQHEETRNVLYHIKSLYQPKYQLLQNVLKKIEGISNFPFEEVIEVGNAGRNYIFIFEDVASEC